MLGCGSATDSFSAGNANPNSPATPVSLRVFRSDRDSSFFFDARGNLFQINQRTAEIQKFAPDGQRIWSTLLKGRGANQMDTPVAGAVDAQGRVWLVDRALGRLQLLDVSGQPSGNFNAPSPMLRPQDIVIDSQGVFVSDGYEHRVVVFDLSGQFVTAWTLTGGLNYPRGLAFDPSGRLHVADAGNARILILSPTGQILRQYGDGLLLHPRGLSISASGLIAVADSLAGLIQIFSSDLTLLASVRPTSDDRALTPLDVQFAPSGLLYLTAEPAGMV